MSKSVLISIRPEWCKLIARGFKTVEVRKSRPKLETPFNVYIYCTKGKEKLLDVMFDGDECYGETYHGDPVFIKGFPERFYNENYECGNGKIIGEFVVNYIDEITPNESYDEKAIESEPYCFHTLQTLASSCLSKKKIQKYLKDNPGYGWYISDLVIYDTPRELSEFGKAKPPQSWCYID